jgi:heme exporter protein D
VGRAAAISVMMFIITLIISILLFVSMGDKDEKVLAKQRRQKEREYRKQQKALKGGN